MRGLFRLAACGGHSSLRCAGLSLLRPLLLRSTGSRRAGSAVVAHGPSCSAACGILPDQGSNPCALHWQADSQPLLHQGSPRDYFLSPARKDTLKFPLSNFSKRLATLDVMNFFLTSNPVSTCCNWNSFFFLWFSFI